MSDFDARAYVRKKYGNKDEEEEEVEKTTSSDSNKEFNARDYVTEKYRKQAADAFGLDTFETDLANMGNTISNIYSGWQTPETMANTKTLVEGMQKRVNDYATYQKKYMPDSTFDVDSLVKGYQTVLDDWDNLTKSYSYFKDAESYKNYPKYLEEQNKQKEENLKKWDSAFEPYAYYLEMDDFEERSQYKSTIENKKFLWMDDRHIGDEIYEYVNNFDGKIRGDLLYQHDKYQVNAPIYTPSKYAEMGLDFLTPDEIKVFNVIYEDSGKEAAYKFLEDMKPTLLKRGTEQMTNSIKESDNGGLLGEVAMAAASVPMMIGGSIYSGIENVTGLIKGESNPYSVYNSVTNAASAIREGQSEKIEEMTEGSEIFGANPWSQLYNFTMSTADSMVGIGSLGKLYSLTASSNAYQQKAKELTDAGADEDEVLILSTASAIFEGLFEYASIEKLFSTKNADSIKNLAKNAIVKQGLFEGSEELATEGANIIADYVVRGEGSNIVSDYKDMLARGYSESEAKTEIAKQLGSQLGWSFLGGVFSGGIVGGLHGAGQYGDLKNIGSQIRSNDRVSEMLGVASDNLITPNETEAYKLYTEYAKGGVNAENITNAQLGNLYATLENETIDTLRSKKTSTQDKFVAARRLEGLSTVAKAKNTVNAETGDAVKIEGVKTVDGKKVLQTSEGEMNTKDIKMSYNDSVIKSHADGMDDSKASLLWSQYDGQTDVDSYIESFNLMHSYGETGFGTDYALQNKGVLSDAQAIAIYKEGVASKARASADAFRYTVDEIVGEGLTIEKFNDSIIDYDGTGEGSVKLSSLTRGEREQLGFAKILASGLNNAKMEVIESKVVNGKYVGEHGRWDPTTRTIYIDVHAGRNRLTDSNSYIVSTLSHEITHSFEDAAAEEYAELSNHVLNYLSNHYGQDVPTMIQAKRDKLLSSQTYKKNGVTDIADDIVIKEIVADACEEMLINSKKIDEMLNGLDENTKKSFIGKVKETFENILKAIKEAIQKLDPRTREAKALRESQADFEKALELWDKAFEKANQKTVAENTTKEQTSGENVITENTAQLSIRTYENEGRELLHKWLKNSDLDEKTRTEIIEQMDYVYDVATKYAEENGLVDFGSWSETDIVRGPDGSPILSVVVPNGDYPLNIDFSQVCKKRKTLDKVLNALVRAGDLDLRSLSMSDINNINRIIKEHSFEIACGLCFVDSKRYRVNDWADSFTDTYNKLVKSLTKGTDLVADEFNYTGRPVKEAEGRLLKDADDSELNFDYINEVLAKNSSGKAIYRYALAIKNNKDLRSILRSSEIISSAGLDAIKVQNRTLYDLVNSHQGSAKPKLSHGEVPYAYDILLQKKFNAEDAYKVGGVRMQSFSDYMANMFFDYVQMIGDLSAKQLPAHAYTKEYYFAKLFGLTGIKINLSVVPKGADITDEQKARFNKMTKAAKEKDPEFKKLKSHAGLDAEGNYILEDETFPLDKALELQNTKGYDKNCGIIWVGVSDKHIAKMLDDPNVPYIIPYHKSSLNPHIARMRNIDFYNDYTKLQNTRYDSKAKKKVPASIWSFDFYADLAKTNDPKATAANYVKECRDRGYLPKFDQFAKHPNYYKLLVDFRVYDNEGNYAPQGAVQMNFPDDFNEIVGESLREAQDTSARLDASMEGLLSEIRKELKIGHEQFSDRVSNSELAEYDDTALYIRNTKNADYIGMILNGTKTEETRGRRTLDAFIGKDFYVTDGKYVYGSIVLGEPHLYTYEEFHLPENQEKHRVPIGDKYDIKEGGTKWAYPIESYKKFDAPKKLSDSKEYKNSFQARQVMYSDRDSEGTQLTSEQMEYFKDSKARDAEGNLQVVYHGTRYGGFNKFSYGAIGSATDYGYLGRGFYFTKRESVAKYYAGYLNSSEVKKGYVNITNPIILPDKRNLAYYMESLMESGSFDILYEEDANYERSVAFTKWLKNNGYDGVICDNEIMVLDSNQFKNIDNKKPTSDPDIRYSDRIDDFFFKDLDLDEVIEYLIDEDMDLFLSDNEETKLSPKKERAKRRVDEVNKRLKKLGLAFNGTKNLAWTNERIEKYLSGSYYGSSNPKYAKAYIAYVTPQQFLNLTVGGNTYTLDRIENETRQYGDLDFEKLGDSHPIFLEIEEGKTKAQVEGHEGRHRMLMLGEAGFEKVPVLLFDYRTKYNKTAKSEMKLIAQKFNSETFISSSRNTVITDVIPFSQGNRDLIIEKFGSGNANADVRYADRYEDAFMELFDSEGIMAASSAIIEEDVDRLIERRSMGETKFDDTQVKAIAKYLRDKVNNSYDLDALMDDLKDIYSYIDNTDSLDGNALMAKCYDVARRILDAMKATKVTNDYAKMIMKDIRGTKIKLDEKQIQEAKNRYGENYRKSLWGRIFITNEGISLDSKWAEWSTQYPDIFDANISSADQITELADIYDSLRTASEVKQEYDTVNDVRALGAEIYNQYWIRSTTNAVSEEYDQKIKALNLKHRNAMKKLREDYQQKLDDKQNEIAIMKNAIRSIRLQKEAEVRSAKQAAKDRMDKYKDRVNRNAKIEQITKNALTLNDWLKKNSKDHHIPEVMRGPVAYLLNAIDFSSKQLLGMTKYNNFVPTKTDISLSEALEQVHSMVVDANQAQLEEDFIFDFPPSMQNDIRDLSKHVNIIMRTVGDNAYVLNQMSLEELESLDALIKLLKSSVTKMNEFLAVKHSAGVADLSQNSMAFFKRLGKHIDKTGKISKAASKLLKWGNITPYYAFKRFGEGGVAVYKALQSGWDRFAFNVKDIIDYAEETYTEKEVKEWSEHINEITVLEPSSDAERKTPGYTPKNQKIYMTDAQIMSLYCLQKREQAKGHLVGGGIRPTDIETGKKVISQPDGAMLSENDIDRIVDKYLSKRQIAVADKLQHFMNSTCTDWGNEVSMERFGFKAFGEPNYFPIQSDKNNLAVDDAVEQNSLYRLLNMSFTKGTIKNANNRVLIGNIFDVFAQHTSDMAKYNALALPVLDAFKWFNYKEKEFKGDTQRKEKSLKQAMEYAYGKDALGYFTTFMRDLNGEKSVGRDGLSTIFFSNAKIASVAGNIRVVALQPTSYVRASAVIDGKYLARAFAHKPKIAKAEEHCGIALWKSLGYYDTNIQRGVAEQIKHDKTKKDKAVEFLTKWAGKADEITWGYLWNACELEVRDKRKDLKVGDPEFYKAVGEKLREVIYATQVVDSTMTRSQMMRSNDFGDKMMTAFMSEPTISYNMLADAYMEWKLTERETGSKQKAFKKHGGRMARVFAAYTFTNMLAALVEAGFDIFRDTDDEEEEFLVLYLQNLLSDMSVLAKIPYVSEAIGVEQMVVKVLWNVLGLPEDSTAGKVVDGLSSYSASRTESQWISYLTNALSGIDKIVGGSEKTKAYTIFKNLLRSGSSATGIPGYNLWRDTTAFMHKAGILDMKDIEELFDDTLGEFLRN